MYVYNIELKLNNFIKNVHLEYENTYVPII